MNAANGDLECSFGWFGFLITMFQSISSPCSVVNTLVWNASNCKGAGFGILESSSTLHHPSHTGYVQRPFHCLQDVFQLKRNLESLPVRPYSPQLPLHRHLLVESGKDKRQKMELVVPALPCVASVESSQLDPLVLVEGKYENWKFEKERVLQEHFCSSAITTIYT